MTGPQRLHVYGYVDRPYDAVRGLLCSKPIEVMQRATNTASERARNLITRLHLEAGGVEVGLDVRVEAGRTEEEAAVGGLYPVTHLELSWRDAREDGLFPAVSGDLALTPMTFGETRIDFEGTYRPRMATAGKVFDALVGHRIIEAMVHRFVNDLVEQTREEIPPSASR